MVQPAYQIDQLQVEPGSGQTLTISRDAATGSLKFVDAVVTGGINLSDLAGLASIGSVFVVGSSGAGATYTTVQAALDAVPLTSSATQPNVILLTPGVYQENLTISKDGVALIGMGEVRLKNSGAASTVTIQPGAGSVPLTFLMRGVKIENDSVGQDCVSITGVAATTLGSDELKFESCTFVTSNVGNFPINASIANNIKVENCQLSTDPNSILQASQVASLVLKSCTSVPLVQLSYTNAGVLPSILTSEFVFEECTSILTTSVSMTGVGSFTATGCPSIGDYTISGDRTSTFSQCNLGNLSINNTSVVVLTHCTRGTAAGAGTLDEDLTQGTVSFAASATQTVALPVSRSSNVFTILLDTGDATPSFASNKTTTGFDVTFTAPITTTVRWILRG